MQDIQARDQNPYRTALRQLRRTFIQVGLFSAAINILMLTGPIYMLQVYDRVLSSGSVATLQGLFLIVVVLYTFLGLYDFLRARLLSRAGFRLESLVGEKAFAFWLRANAGEGQADHNPMRELEVVRNFVSGPAVAGLFDLPWIPLFLAIVFFIHPWLGWLTLGGALVVALAAWLNQMLTRQAIGEAMALDAGERSFADRSRRNAEALRTLGMQERVMRRWRELREHALARSQQGSERSEGFSAFSKSFRLLLQSALLTLGAFLAIHQEVSAGAIIATSIIAGRALAPVDQVIGQWRAIGRALTSHQTLTEILDRIPPERPHLKLPEPTGRLEVNRITKLVPGQVRIDDKSKILDRVSFALEPGDGLAVIGNSAAGKSSLARLLVGLWQPDLGEIRLDGATLDQWHPEDLGRFIGYLPQTFDLLPGSIAENISRFDPEAKDADVVEAARIAGVHEMILGLADGYSTRIGGAVQPLSGGQIQRLGLARAIYGMPRVIVLDEPNSNLDGQGDEALAVAIRTLRARGAVVIVMAHRPSVISAVNKVLILHKGMAQFGEKDDIMRRAFQSASPDGERSGRRAPPPKSDPESDAAAPPAGTPSAGAVPAAVPEATAPKPVTTTASRPGPVAIPERAPGQSVAQMLSQKMLNKRDGRKSGGGA